MDSVQVSTGPTRIELAPTLLSRPELDVDIRAGREDLGTSAEVPGELDRFVRIAEILTSRQVYVDLFYPDPYLPTIVTATPYVDRREADAMLSVLLRELGFHHVKLVWLRERFIIEPVSLSLAAS